LAAHLSKKPQMAGRAEFGVTISLAASLRLNDSLTKEFMH